MVYIKIYTWMARAVWPAMVSMVSTFLTVAPAEHHPCPCTMIHLHTRTHKQTNTHVKTKKERVREKEKKSESARESVVRESE